MFASPSWIQAAELAPSLQTDMEVKDAIQGAIQGENGEVVQIVSSVATWGTLDWPRTVPSNMTWQVLMEQQRSKDAFMKAILSKNLLKKIEVYQLSSCAK